MNTIFVTTGSMYPVYFDAYNELKIQFDKVGFYVSNSSTFKKNYRNNTEIQYLKEWELTSKIKNIKVDYHKLSQFEDKYFKDESIWHSLNNDRRVFRGLYVKHKQSYTPYYNYDNMLKLFQITVEEIEKFIDEVKPNAVFGVTPATFGDYIFYKIVKEKKIKYYSLKSVKILNYQTFTSSISEEHEHIHETFLKKMKGKKTDKFIAKQSEDFLKKFEKGNSSYEGNVKNQKNTFVFKFNDLKGITKNLIKDLATLGSQKDHQNRGSYFLRYLYDNPIKNFNTKIYKKLIKNRTISDLDIIENGNFIFYPLHAEPEIAITNYSRFYQNQIEVIRTIALNMPVKFKLIVKEHPRNIGRRSIRYYKKILEIPNVNIVDYNMPSNAIVKKSKLIIVLSGHIGFEAVLLGKPVIILGNAIYKMLPNHLVNFVDNIKDLKEEILNTIHNCKSDSSTVNKFISSIIENSFKLNLYTVLLKKVGREGGEDFTDNKYKSEIKSLSNEIRKKLEF